MTMIWDDIELQHKLQYKQSMMCVCSHAIDINGDDDIKETAIILNQKNTTLQLLQAHNNIGTHDRGANSMLFSLSPLSKNHDLSHALCNNGGDNFKQVTIMLNK